VVLGSSGGCAGDSVCSGVEGNVGGVVQGVGEVKAAELDDISREV